MYYSLKPLIENGLGRQMETSASLRARTEQKSKAGQEFINNVRAYMAGFSGLITWKQAEDTLNKFDPLVPDASTQLELTREVCRRLEVKGGK